MEDLTFKEIKTISDWLENDDKACVDIVKSKYLQEIKTGILEKPDQFIERVASGDQYYKMISELYFIPGGRILANRGMQRYGIKVTYNNCYVLEGPDDNIESIYEVAKKMARTFSYGGGVGIDISKLAPKNSKVNNSAKMSTGAVSFCETYSSTATTIGQRGRRK